MSLLAPLTAHSLGVGDIKLYSALNQKLNAEIALTLAADEELADIKVTLASPDKFDKVGIAWSYFLSKVKFVPIQKANGKVIIKMTSNEVVQEPFLDFLVEVSWPKGDIFKEFTVLVDPPVVYQQAKVTAPAVHTTNYIAPAVQADSVSQPAYVDDNNYVPSSTGEYGPTSRSDALWGVAGKVNPYSDISRQQMMMALYKANPHAFYGKNINALMQKQVLRVPDREEILALSQRQAEARFDNQMSAWKGNPVTTQTAKNTPKESHKQLILVPPVDDVLSNADVLTANTVEQSALAEGNQQLQEKLAKLEAQLSRMKEVMVIKDQQLANMQQAQAGVELTDEQKLQAEKNAEQIAEKLALIESVDIAEQKAQAEAEALVKKKAAEEAEDLARQQEIADAAELAKKQLAGNAENIAGQEKPVSAVKDPKIETVAQQDAVESIKKPAQAVVTPPVHKVKPKRKPPVVQPVVEPEEGPDYYMIGMGLFGLLSAGTLGWFLWRRRKNESETNENSMFAASSSIFLPDAGEEHDELNVPVLDTSASYDVGSVDESSFLSEFTPSDFDVFETDQTEVDPTSEADVYLAYGRYQQAEELIQQAIVDHPENDEYKLKLLEIFHTSENVASFESYANDLTAEGKNTDLEFWNAVSDMGRDLLPDSALFSAEQTESHFAVTDESEGRSAESEEALSVENDAVDFDISSLNVGDETTDTEASDAGEGIDFDLSDFSMDEDSSTEAVALDDSQSSDEVEGIEFDLDSFAVEEGSTTEPEALVEEVESVDFDLDSFAVEEGSTTEPEALVEEIESVDFDLDSFATEDDSAATEPEALVEEVESIDFDLDSFAVEEDSTTEPAALVEEVESVDFDLDSFAVEEDSSSEPVALVEEVESVDFDLDSFAVEESDVTEPNKLVEELLEPEESEKFQSEDDSSGDFDFDFDKIAGAGAAASVAEEPPEEDLVVSDLTDMDELETKIDLAKAFIDMGNDEAAQDTLLEVLEKGSDAQKSAAQEIMDKLS
ncbi:MAG: hypothetical protein GQ582_04250 [Methyloprofundus sp.]|nr:hypothetical protein [Methyloprofundus sp.]